jgi:hypothetical protein
MTFYKSIKNCGKNLFLVGGLVTVLTGCNNPDADSHAKSQETFLRGTVEYEEISEGWYQVTLYDHNRFSKSAFNLAPECYDVRFYGNYFDLMEIDKKINPGTKLELVVVNVGNVWESKKKLGYHWRAVAINKVE